MTDWDQYAKFKDLRSVIDPADNRGYKNKYINLLHHQALADAIGDTLKGKRVLDLGCGIGRFTEFLVKRGAIVTGVDSCQEMLDQNTGCKTICASVDKLPFEDESFDAVLSVWTLQFLSDAELQKATAEINRVLVPGGTVYLIEQISKHGYDDVFPRLPIEYKNQFLKYKRISIRGISYNNEKIFGFIKTGIIPESAFFIIAALHLNYSEHLPIPNTGYLDCRMVFRKELI